MLDLLFNLPKSPHAIGTFKVHRWATPAEGMALYTLLQAHEIRSYIECGTANGYTASWAAAALRDVKGAQLHTWDIEERPKVWQKFPELVPLGATVRCHVKPFHEGVASAFAPGPRLFFIDGHHTRRAVRRDWSSIQSLLEPGDVVVFHDAREEGVLGLCEHLSSVRGYRGGIVRTERDMGVYFA